MIRWMATVLSLLFCLGAGLSASGLGMDSRSFNAGDTQLLLDYQAQDLAADLLQADADPDAPNDSLMSVEVLDGAGAALHGLPSASSTQGLAMPRGSLATPSLSSPYLAALLRPPIFSA